MRLGHHESVNPDNNGVPQYWGGFPMFNARFHTTSVVWNLVLNTGNSASVGFDLSVEMSVVSSVAATCQYQIYYNQ